MGPRFTSASIVCRAWLVMGLVAAASADAQHVTDFGIPREDATRLEVPHGLPNPVFQPPETILTAEWEVTLLPDGYVPLAASPTGVVLLYAQVGDWWQFHRWQAGHLDKLVGTDWQNQGGDHAMNNFGEIAIARFNSNFQITGSGTLSTYRDFHQIWRTDEKSFGRYYEPPAIVQTIPDEEFPGVVHVSRDQNALLIQVDDNGRLWIRRSAASPDEVWTVNADGTVDVLAIPATDLAHVSRGGHSIVHSTETWGTGRYYVDEVELPSDRFPFFINNRGETLLWIDDSPNPPRYAIRYPDGQEELLPASLMMDLQEIWLDELGRVNAVDNNGRLIVYVKRLDANGVPVEPVEYDALDFLPLSVGEQWTTDLQVAPGAVEPQLGIATPVGGGASRHFLARRRNFLAVDANRDGAIDPADPADQPSTEAPFRFWTNDDDDFDAITGDDVPAPSSSDDGSEATNFDGDGNVDGLRDLIDFFPVYLDIKSLLATLPASASIKYKLKHADGALNFVYTKLTRNDAETYQTQDVGSIFGPTLNESIASAGTRRISAAGVELTSEFLNGVKNSDWGVILVEAWLPTMQPLVLSVEKSDGTVLVEVTLPLAIRPVEEMYRHVDLTAAALNYDSSAPSLPAAPRATSTGEPADYPDSLTNGKYFVFVHGYNVDAQKARGWHCEVFKRLRVLGSKARFVGVTWHGTTGLDYHKAVFNAFETGDALGAALSFTGSADVTIAAHSLGNMVVSHAIQSGGFTPSRYYLINAAVPIEAYSMTDVGANEPAEMTEQSWRSYDPRLYAANWHVLFSAADNRSKLTWKKRFETISLATGLAHNFFSSEEDVVADAPDKTTASVAASLLAQGFDFSTGAWKSQELVKGVTWTTSLAGLFMERGQAGWDFNADWNVLDGDPPAFRRLMPEETTSITNEQLVTSPFFDDFLEGDLVNGNAAVASAKAGESNVRYDLLARAIPAMSNAAAANFMQSLGADRNFPIHTTGKATGNGPFPTPNSRWRHSDVKVVALLYVHPMYEAMINRGALK